MFDWRVGGAGVWEEVADSEGVESVRDGTGTSVV